MIKESEKRSIEIPPEKGVTRREFLGTAAAAAAGIAIAGAAPLLISGCSGTSYDADFDMVIKGGTIYDGVHSKPYRADIGIKGDRIAAIGKINGRAAKTIDASGLVVTPGFIDIHTHCDLTFQKTGAKRHLARVMPSWKGNYNYLYQGVTTVVTGNCGYGYTDTRKWLGMVNSIEFGTNVAHLAPHGMLREELFGEKQPVKLDAAQLAALKKRVAEEVEKGALGVSTGLEYAPGLLSDTAELIEVARMSAHYGGIYATHMRDETGRATKNGKAGVFEAIEEALEVGRRANIPVEISHLKISAPIGGLRGRNVLDLIRKARAEGLDVTADQYPYNAGSTYISILLPEEMRAPEGVRDIFKTKEGKKQIREAIEKSFIDMGPEKTLISWYPGNEKLEGKNLKEIADMTGKPPSECYAEMVCDEKCPMGVFFSMDMDIVREIMPAGFIITASDGWTVPKDMMKPHPRVYGTFPRKLREFVMKEKILSLPDAIRSMTSLPAEKFRIRNRGILKDGYFADITVFDANTIRDKATYQDPHQYSEGVRFVLVNGTVSIENGIATGDRAGRGLPRA